MEISKQQLKTLDALLRRDGICLSEEGLLTVAYWLLAQVKEAARPIPPSKQEVFEAIQKDTLSRWTGSE